MPLPVCPQNFQNQYSFLAVFIEGLPFFFFFHYFCYTLSVYLLVSLTLFLLESTIHSFTITATLRFRVAAVNPSCLGDKGLFYPLDNLPSCDKATQASFSVNRSV